jgi:hypothetical protein
MSRAIQKREIESAVEVRHDVHTGVGVVDLIHPFQSKVEQRR